MANRERLNAMLSAYLDGELTPEERADIERRVEEDPEARAELNNLRVLRGALGEAPSIDFERDRFPELLRTIQDAAPARRPRRRPWLAGVREWWDRAPGWQPAMAAALAAAAAVGLWMYADGGRVSEQQFAALAGDLDLYENWDVITEIDLLEDYEAILHLDQMDG